MKFAHTCTACTPGDMPVRRGRLTSEGAQSGPLVPPAVGAFLLVRLGALILGRRAAPVR